MKNCLSQFVACAHRQTGLLGLLIALSATVGAWTASAQTTGLTIGISSSGTVCAGSSVTLTASGCPTAGTLRWSTAQTGASVVVTPTQTSVYSLSCVVVSTPATSTTATGATTTTTASATVPVYPAITLTSSLTAVSCNGRADGRVVVSATGGRGALQYQLNNQPFQAGNAFEKLAAGTYSVAARDAQGCTVRSSVDVKQPAPLSLSITAVGAKCTGGSDGGLIAVASGGNGGYKYYLGTTLVQDNGTFLDLKANTTYTVAVVDRLECALFRDVQIGAPTPFDIKLTAAPTRCVGSADGSIAVAVAGGSGTYQYQIGTGPFQTGSQFTGLTANSYQVTVQDANGCQGKATAVVPQPAPLKLSAVAGPVNCFGPNSGSITVTPSGGTGAVTYQLTAAGAGQTSNVFKGLSTGEYTVVGTDANGCTGLTSATITTAEPLKAQATISPAACCICPTGAIRVTSTGGTGSGRQYQIIGQAYQANPLITNLRPNIYRLRVVDEAGCADSVVAIVTDANAMTLSAGTIKNVSCAGGSDGQATVQVVGGTKPYTFYWQTERRDTLRSRTSAQTGLTEGTYTISVLDSNRCSAPTTTVTLRALAPLPGKPSVSQSGGTLTVGETSGIQWYVQTGADSVKLVPGATQPTLVPFQSGQYYAVVTQNGCASPPSQLINFVLTALVEPRTGLSVRVVPNPVVDRLRLEIEQTDRSAVVVHLLDASGRVVLQHQIPAFTGKKQAEWPLAGVPTGTYLLTAEAGQRKSVMRVVVE